MIHATDKQWKIWGKINPYFGVLSTDEYKNISLDDEKKKKFFESGDRHIEYVMSIINNYIDPSFKPKLCLDFGCGVGRIIIPLAYRFSHVTGVDISQDMLDEASRNCVELGLNNVELVESDDNLSKLHGKYDFIHSTIVFQHINPKRGEVLFKRLVDLLDDGGVGVIHLTYYARQTNTRKTINWMKYNIPYLENIVNIFKGRSFYFPSMQMHMYKLNNVFSILQDNGCEHMCVRFSNHGGVWGIRLYFQKSNVGIY